MWPASRAFADPVVVRLLTVMLCINILGAALSAATVPSLVQVMAENTWVLDLSGLSMALVWSLGHP
jgi:hypothetical protein